MKTLPQRKNVAIPQKYEKFQKYEKYRSGDGRLGKPPGYLIRLQTPINDHPEPLTLLLGCQYNQFKILVLSVRVRPLRRKLTHA